MANLPTAGASAPMSFSFDQSFNVRAVMLDGEPWFIARDVAEALGYANPSEAVSDHCKRLKILKTSKSLPWVPARGYQIIPEPDVYRLIVRSNLPSAERFENWIFEDVLPSIRKTGGYQLPEIEIPQTLETVNSADLQKLSHIVYLLKTNFHMEGSASHAAYARLRKEFGLEKGIASLPTLYLDQAIQILSEMNRLAFAFKGLVIEAERKFFRQVLRSGKPLDDAEFNALFDAELKQMIENHSDALKLLN